MSQCMRAKKIVISGVLVLLTVLLILLVLEILNFRVGRGSESNYEIVTPYLRPPESMPNVNVPYL